MPHKTTGLVLGKFMPLHQGHELLLRFANGFVDQLYVVVDHPPEEPISGETRCRWIRETVPQAHVFYLPEPTPQDPSEHPDFWNHWRDLLLRALPSKPDYLFASESYGFKLAEIIGAQFVPLDLKRETIPISGTEIRENRWASWDYLSAAAKPDYLVRICIFGPESTGKSTLCKELAEHFNTIHVPEYARLVIEAKGDVQEHDMLAIAQGQMALERALAPKANRILFCDTDALATSIWQRWLFGRVNPAIEALAKQNRYDLYLLMEPDLPWIPDQVRYFEGRSEEFLSDCVGVLEAYQKRYSRIGGQGEARTQAAISAIQTCLQL